VSADDLAARDSFVAGTIGWGRWAAFVFAVFLVYNLNFRDILIGDPIPATLLPISILREANFDLDEFSSLLEANPRLAFLDEVLGITQTQNGHRVSSYPVGGSILATPLYAVLLVASPFDEWWHYRVAGKLAASLMVALSAGLVLLAVADIAGKRAGWILATAYAFATDAWTVASQAMWQHGPGMLCLALTALMLLRMEKRPANVIAALAGAGLGAALVVRPLNLVPGFVFGMFVLVRHRRQLLAFCAPLAILGSWLLWYNASTFGNLLGGYDAVTESPAHAWMGITPATIFSYPFWPGLAANLISPNKGLLVFSPYLAFAFGGIAVAWRATSFPLARYLATWVVMMLVLFSKFAVWSGGGSWGPRYMCELFVPMTLLLACLWPKLCRRRAALAVFGFCVALSVAVQVIGAFFSPCGYGGLRSIVDPYGTAWRWRNPEILRCLSVGLEEGPRPFEFLDLLSKR